MSCHTHTLDCQYDQISDSDSVVMPTSTLMNDRTRPTYLLGHHVTINQSIMHGCGAAVTAAVSGWVHGHSTRSPSINHARLRCSSQWFSAWPQHKVAIKQSTTAAVQQSGVWCMVTAQGVTHPHMCGITARTPQLFAQMQLQ